MRRWLTDFLFRRVEKSYAKLGTSLYYDREVEAMIEGNVNRAIDEVIDIAYDESYFFITQRLIESGMDEEELTKTLNGAQTAWVNG